MEEWKQSITGIAHERGLPQELVRTIFDGKGSEFLDAVAQASLDLSLTDLLLPLYIHTAADTTQRWLQQTNFAEASDRVRLVSTLARTLPFLPYLRSVVCDFLKSSHVLQFAQLDPGSSQLDDDSITLVLTALFRLLSHDRDAFQKYVKPVDLCLFFSHERLHIRYLSIECFCMVMQFADAFTENLVHKHIDDQAILAVWEGKEIDYRLLKIHEEQRWADLEAMLSRINATTAFNVCDANTVLAVGAASIAGVIVPSTRQYQALESSFVRFPTSTQNLMSAAKTLLRDRPTLLVGASGSGKTSIIRELAYQTDALPGLITLHLNDQTDAKSLLGIYTSSQNGGGFTWQPGILTQAVKEGKWLIIEDIDRAPSEVIGLLRPLIESGELFLPSRKERIRPNHGFRIFGTIRGSVAGTAHFAKNAFLSNSKMWSMVEVTQYTPGEIETLLSVRFPTTTAFLPGLSLVHSRIIQMYSVEPAFRAIQNKAPSIKDLIKWTRRLSLRLTLSTRTVQGTVPETMMLDIFRDALDCYVAHLQDEHLFEILTKNIAEGLNIAPNVAEHSIKQYNPALQEQNSRIHIGRSSLPRSNVNRSKNARNMKFALTRQVRQNMESIVSAISMQEPLLLVGETGVGKTTILQYIAASVGQSLTVVNLSNQSEASDLLGGLKPVTARSLVVPLVDEFDELFRITFSAGKNAAYRDSISKAFAKQRWQKLLDHWEEAIRLASKTLPTGATTDVLKEQSAKRRKLDSPKYEILREKWYKFASDVSRVKAQIQKSDRNQIFTFVESRLVQTVRAGGWLLLDEINLASSETLDSIVSLLHTDDGDSPHLLLAESGSIERIDAHPNFRVFGAMNPATDIGKKDLPTAIRTQFTELYVQAGDNSINDLVEVIQSYLGAALDHDKKAGSDLASAYLALKQLNACHKLVDGAGEVPHFSLRSLTRCLQYVQQYGPVRGLRRAIYDGLQMSFCTVLDTRSQRTALEAIETALVASKQAKKALQSQKPRISPDKSHFIQFEDHAVVRGTLDSDPQPHYIVTQSVRRNLVNLARAASMTRFPILLQGPTSAGKTSMVEYLAKYSGNEFVRINNHEHTDLQEYLGSYASATDGKLEYRDGVLVEALRKGHWIVLDELNLAPSDVLEALNRLLDDNRELLIPETQEIIHPHPNFMLFATQNPAGLYGGRKRFSRAFRNRFLEIHVDDIPENELKTILSERMKIAPSYCEQIVAVYRKLSLQRSSSRLFEARNSFATLRDLFRWASRPIESRLHLANHGYMLLAERVREPAEKAIVKLTIEETLKVTIDEQALYNGFPVPTNNLETSQITWTKAMRRLFLLVSTAVANNEPVLLVGETGCGKTQVCQCIAAVAGKQLNVYNAHSNTETGDLIGSQRPVRHKSELAEAVLHSMRNLGDQYEASRLGESIDIADLISQFRAMDTSAFDSVAVEKVTSSIAAYQSLFTWSDGTLVHAMREGCHFLLDEISLADDSVLERMNSVLEPSRTILLAEKGAENNLVVALPGFQFLATMNPGGDYGKRELSAALRNRLTEIWVPPLSDDDDVVPILRNKLGDSHITLAPLMVDFAKFFQNDILCTFESTLPLRLLLNWVEFVVQNPSLSVNEAMVHGAAMNFIDSLGANPAGLAANTARSISEAKILCLDRLSEMLNVDTREIYFASANVQVSSSTLVIEPFSVPISILSDVSKELNYAAPTTATNAMRIVRALQTNRPLLLEGNPGVGKTAIVSSLASICGRPLTRVNLSDQTDLMDLFGADAPAEGERLGNFVWRDGPVLTAMQTGGWVLLDEMNLASQSVLEGLNACLDHRKEIYIAELDKTFHCHAEFRLFATQNPHVQGGGRKGLPASFVNRFTVVYADSFTRDDLLAICVHKYPNMPVDTVSNMVLTVDRCQQLATQDYEFSEGGPWELNLRDLDRWLELCSQNQNPGPSYHFRTVIGHRFRSESAKVRAEAICHEILGEERVNLYHDLSCTTLQIGSSFSKRDEVMQHTPTTRSLPVALIEAAKSFLVAVCQGWPVILTGRSGIGKTTLIRSMAALLGVQVMEFSMNNDVDTADLVGGYEQYDLESDLRTLQIEISACLSHLVAVSDMSNEAVAIILGAHTRLTQENMDCTDIITIVHEISQTTTAAAKVQLKPFLERVQRLGGMQPKDFNRFSWNDGFLIDAMLAGSWLVLDNANLCSPSVLDRLNSLLEPGGYLVLNEQHGANGNARVIHPAPGFRIVLTADTRFGELSRAMRNRSLELSLDSTLPVVGEHRLPEYSTTSRIARVRPLLRKPDLHQLHLDTKQTLEPWIDRLTQQDIELLNAHPSHLISENLQEEIAIRVNGQPISFASVSVSSITIGPSMQTVGKDYWPYLLTINEPLLLRLLDLFNVEHVVSLTRLQMLNTMIARGTLFLNAIANGCFNSSIPESRLVNTNPTFSKTRRERKAHIPAYQIMVDFGAFLLSAKPQVGAHVLDASQVELMRDTTMLYKDLLSLFHQKDLDTGTIQSYLQVIEDMRESAQGINPVLEVKLREVSKSIGIMGRLTTGQSLRKMWPTWRAPSAISETQLNTCLAIEALIGRFDMLARYIPQSRAELIALRVQILDLYNSSGDMDDTLDCVSKLATAVEDLAPKMPRRAVTPGHFASIFDKVAYKMRLQRIDVSPAQSQICVFFGGIAPVTSPRLLNATSTSPYSLLERFVDDSVFAEENVEGSLLPAELSMNELTQLLQSSQDQPLGRLNFAQEEIQQMIGLFSSMTQAVTTPNTGPVFQLTHDLLIWLLKCHPEMMGQTVLETLQDGSRTIVNLLEVLQHIPNKYRDVIEQSIGPNLGLILCDLHQLQSITTTPPDNPVLCGSFLMHVSIACLKLFVPDQKFDPSKFYALLNERHKKREIELLEQNAAWKTFQNTITGQDTSFIIKILEADLLGAGNLNSVPLAYRPSDGSSDALHIEFSNLLRNIVNTESAQKICEGDTQESKLLLGKIKVCLVRLASIHRAYDDLVKPIVGLLHSLAMGIKMTVYGQQHNTNGGDSHNHDDDEHPRAQYDANESIGSLEVLTSNKSINVQDMNSVSSIWAYLEQMKVKLAITKSIMSENDELVSHIVSVIDRLYTIWKQRLDKDQQEAVTQSRYYSYRGGDDDEQDASDSELRDLFPNVEDDNENVLLNSQDVESSSVLDDSHYTTSLGLDKASFDVRKSAIALSIYHRSLFTQLDIQKHLQSCMQEQLMPRDGSHVGFVERREISAEIMPAMLLTMEQKLFEISDNTATRATNIYKDSDTFEAQKLFDITTSAIARFSEIAEQWPEHTVPIDVLRYCDEVLKLKISDPVAKLLTKTEKMLEVVAQWQAVASREWSVTNILDVLTNLIVRWRRLELASWSRLLDDEDFKLQEDVNAWYFIAYESIIFDSLSKVQQFGSHETDATLSAYRYNLARTLEDYLRNTTLGQFSGRLDLLHTFAITLRACTKAQVSEVDTFTCNISGMSMLYAREPSNGDNTICTGTPITQLQDICDTIDNIIDHHRRYEPQVKKILNEGRMVLEKKVTEQIQLASWKDTNITALRESARRSHNKLFRIVKKYRSLLMKPLQDPATVNVLPIDDWELKITALDVKLADRNISESGRYCADQIKDWSKRPERLRDTVVAANTMVYMYQSCFTDFAAASEVHTWVEDIESAAKELRKATPTISTKDNAVTIRDLKQRKRRLLADALKDLVGFGIRKNLGTNELARQDSTAAILSGVPNIPDVSGLNNILPVTQVFHELIVNLPLARQAALEHSDDLTDGEVRRCLGYLEGTLSLANSQRGCLGNLRRGLIKFSSLSTLVDNLQRTPNLRSNAAGGLRSSIPETAYLLGHLQHVLLIHAKVVQTQGTYGSFDTNTFTSMLQRYSDKFEEYSEAYRERKLLPTGVEAVGDFDLQIELRDTLADLNDQLTLWAKQEPRTEHVCASIKRWTGNSSSPAPQKNSTATINLVQADENVQNTLNSIFVALQTSSENLKILPASRDVPGWLIKYTTVLQRVIGSMQLEQILPKVANTCTLLRHIDTQDSQTTLSLVIVAAPIILQYQAILEDIFNRLLHLHYETCRLSVFVSRMFITLAKDGFCSPLDTDKSEGNSSKLEQGTGLGDGDAAQDISKDVGDEEDLTDLAQEGTERKEESESMDKSKDAVDMGSNELEGEMESGDEEEKVSGDEDDDNQSGDEQDIDEETGDVDDLDPNSVDEKMWDDMKKEAENKEKEMKSEKSQGHNTEEQTARQEGDAGENEVDAEQNKEDANEETASDQDEIEEGRRAEGEEIDQNLDNQETLDLPDDIQLNGEDERGDNLSDADMDELSDVDDIEQNDNSMQMDLPDENMVDREGSITPEDDGSTADADEDRTGEAEDADIVDPSEDEIDESLRETQESEAAIEGQDQDEGQTGAANTNQDHTDSLNDENAPPGQNDTETSAQDLQKGQPTDTNALQESGTASGATEMGSGRQEDALDKQDKALKKLADVLEKFHQRREIFTSSEQRNATPADHDVDMEDVDFEHFGDTDEALETQAMGTAEDETAQNLDNQQAIEDNGAKEKDDLPMPEDIEPSLLQAVPETLVEKMDRLRTEPGTDREHNATNNMAFEEMQPQNTGDTVGDIEMDLDHFQDDDVLQSATNPQLQESSTILPKSTSSEEAQQLWSMTSNKTQALSLGLTEQLRLILQPTAATKLRGDFRTGKRLNIRRIIPYIASGYKRDKIWMRRSVPVKRNYQIMLAVDDSRSMAESGADILALETLCMLSRSLSMLEVGELSIVAFGKDYQDNDSGLVPKAVRVAHPFSSPFVPSISGPETFSNFTFNQTGTNIRALLADSIAIFKDARLNSSAREAADLWQLQIIISDGHIGSDGDDGVRRLVRKAREEKIVSVFVVVDNGKESIVNLKEATLDKDGEVKMKRYLEGFPFAYYIVVREIHDLSGVICRVLKGWFEGVVEQ